MFDVYRFLAAGLAGLVLFAGSAHAGPVSLAAAPALPGSREAEAVSRVTVTARKTQENVQKIPVAVSVFSSDQMVDARIIDTAHLVRFAPNVYMKQSTSENMVSIRGVSPFDSSIYSPTAFYVDDILLPLHYMHNLDFFDIEQVEILKGPQGTLYGGNSEAGVITVKTQRPGNAFEGRVSAETGVFSGTDNTPVSGKAGAGFGGPVQDSRFYFRAAGTFEKNPGYMTNLAAADDRAGEQERTNGRVSLGFTPRDRLEISFVADAMENEDKIGVYRFETGPYRTDPYTVRHEQTDWSDESGNGQALKIRYQARGMDLLWVTGRRAYMNENQQDYDCTADPANNWGEIVAEYDDRILTQEFRISSSRPGPFTWLGGLYGFSETTRIRRDNATAMDGTRTRIKSRGWALFGMGTYTLFDRLHLGAGLRYDVQYQEGDHTRFLADGSTGRKVTDRFGRDQDFREVLPKFSLGYDITPKIYTYALVSKGYLTGGYNYVMAVDDKSLTYDPEYVWNHEVGIKATWLDNRLVTNLTFFYLRMTDKQVYEQVTGSNPGTRIDNAARAHTRGAEVEISARPVPGLDIMAGLGLIQGEYDNWVATEWNPDYTGYVQTDYKGRHLPNVPEYTFHVGAQYRFMDHFFVRGDLNGVGGFYGDHANTVKESPYALVNLKLGYETEAFDLYLWGSNIFDRHYHTIKYAWDGEELVQDGEPACFGISMNWRF